MPRTLPWLVGKETTRTLKTTKLVQSKEPKVEPKEEDSDVNTPIVGRSTEPNRAPKRKRRASRTPSTSPPPIPPAEDYMRSGYDKDDGWMMVEDEFYSIAQEFTLPLHRQEYERLKLKARDEGLNVRDIARSTNMLAMREELQRKTEAAALRKKHKRTFDGIKSRLLGGSGSDEDADEDAVSDEEDDPWYGTTLHGLMTSPRKIEKALVGLEKVQSNTRAAAGFSQPDFTLSQLTAGGGADQSARNGRQDEDVADATDSSDDDDLDGLKRMPHPVSRSPMRTARPKLQAPESSVNAGRVKVEERHTEVISSKSKSAAPKGFDDGFDDGLDDLPAFSNHRPATTKPPLKDTKSPLKDKAVAKEKYDGVPTFLV
ncbi:MAG: hypothetical protein Q9160_003094 [Pyrenula sp. 1 TL-2023]